MKTYLKKEDIPWLKADSYYLKEHTNGIRPGIIKYVLEQSCNRTDAIIDSSSSFAATLMAAQTLSYSAVGVGKSYGAIEKYRRSAKATFKKPYPAIKDDSKDILVKYPSNSFDVIIGTPHSNDLDNYSDVMSTRVNEYLFNATAVLKDGGKIIIFAKDFVYNSDGEKEHRCVSSVYETIAGKYGLKLMSMSIYPLDVQSDINSVNIMVFKYTLANRGYRNFSHLRHRLNESLLFEEAFQVKNGLIKVVFDLMNDDVHTQMEYRIAGVNVTQNSRKISAWLFRNFPDIRVRQPKLKLKHEPYIGKTSKDFDPNAVRIYIKNPKTKQWLPLGWIPRSSKTSTVAPNSIVAKILDHDAAASPENRFLANITMSEFGMFDTSEGKTQYYGKIRILINNSNIEDYNAKDV